VVLARVAAGRRRQAGGSDRGRYQAVDVL